MEGNLWMGQSMILGLHTGLKFQHIQTFKNICHGILYGPKLMRGRERGGGGVQTSIIQWPNRKRDHILTQISRFANQTRTLAVVSLEKKTQPSSKAVMA